MLRVVRGEDGKHEVAEYSVQVLLEGDIETSYTQADNSVVVATDSQKNIVYCASLHSHLSGTHTYHGNRSGKDLPTCSFSYSFCTACWSILEEAI